MLYCEQCGISSVMIWTSWRRLLSLLKMLKHAFTVLSWFTLGSLAKLVFSWTDPNSSKLARHGKPPKDSKPD